MIGKLSGQYAGEAGEGLSLVDVQGVGYVVRTTKDALASCAEGSDVVLYIHTAVREDAIDLYGFPSRDSLAFFKLLMSVSGIGPKTALGIMSAADIPSLRRAVARGDVGSLVKLYGIGKKNAERMVVELKDKMPLSGPDTEKKGAAQAAGDADDTDVLEALESLGYSATEARRALRSIPPSMTDLRERVAAALKQLGTPRT